MQVEPLRQQAEKAQKYLVLRDELKGYEITVWLDSLAKIEANAKKAEQDYASAAFILEQAHNAHECRADARTAYLYSIRSRRSGNTAG